MQSVRTTLFAVRGLKPAHANLQQGHNKLSKQLCFKPKFNHEF
jgi:hypothetical protein